LYRILVFLKFLSPAYRRRRESILRFRQIKPRRRKLLRHPMAAYMVLALDTPRPGTNFRLTNIQPPSSLY
jgi:hypothetical protein